MGESNVVLVERLPNAARKKILGDGTLSACVQVHNPRPVQYSHCILLSL